MDIGSRIKKRRKDLGISAEDLARRIGISPATVYRYESNDIANMGADKLSSIAGVLGVNPGYLMGWDEPAPLPPSLRRVESMPRVQLPVIGEVAAGTPIMAENQYEAYVEPGAPLRADYVLTVRGDSMAPAYLDGDVIFIREQPDVDDGQIAVVLIDDSVTLKHIYHFADGITLVSDNPAYPPMRIDPREHECIRVLGIVVGFQRIYASDPLKGVKKGMGRNK